MDHVVDALMDDIWQCLKFEGNDIRTCLEIMKRVRDMMPEHEDMVAQLSEAWKTDTDEDFEFLKNSMASYFVRMKQKIKAVNRFCLRRRGEETSLM